VQDILHFESSSGDCISCVVKLGILELW